jgi:hypothetical protein
MSLFNDPSVWRESSQWKAVFGPTAIGDATSELVSNFGSISESLLARTDISILALKVAEQFAMDVYTELKDEIPTPDRASRTSQAPRDQNSRPMPPQRTPVVTPLNHPRVLRFGHGTALGRDRFSSLR